MSQFRFVFVGTYTEPILFGTGQVLRGKGKGIHVYRFDTLSGALEPYGVAEGVRNPSYLAFHPSRRFLYAVNEYKEFEGRASGAVSAFTLDPDRGQLTFINQKATGGTDPCHLTVTKSGDCVLVANFASGSFCVRPILPDGSLDDGGQFVQHQGTSIDPKRQTGPHAHAVILDNQERFIFVPDLGMDKVMVYELDAAHAKVKPNSTPFSAVRPGAGPRQIVMHPNGQFAYLINELNSTMTAYSYDAAQGTLAEMQTLSTLPEDFQGSSTCAEAQITPTGDLLFGSNRGHNSLVIYAVDPVQGTLRLLGHESTRGSIPRNFTVDPSGDWVIAANQDSDNLAVFRIDHAAGTLIPTGDPVAAPTPVCVKVL
jgi:6-phosphogluconolactonase